MLSLCPSPLRAGAWTQAAGHGQLIVNLSFTQIGHGFDGNGHIQPFGYGGQFRKLEINPYFEYGVTPRTTLLVNAFLPTQRFSSEWGSASSFGLGDVETGVRRRLNSADSRTAVSAQFTVQFPTYSTDRSPAPGNHQMDLSGGLLAGRGFDFGRRHGFFSVAGAYRRRQGPPADQFRSEATFGIDLHPRLSMLAQVFGITGIRNGAANSAVVVTNPNLRSDFDLYKTQLSLVVRLNRHTHVQAGWVSAFAGRNTGHGSTAILALWRDF